MATPQSFRSAFNGFNREDVVHYLEYLNTKHASQLDQLNNEVAFLRRMPSASFAVSVCASAISGRSALIA